MFLNIFGILFFFSITAGSISIRIRDFASHSRKTKETARSLFSGRISFNQFFSNSVCKGQGCHTPLGSENR